MGRLLCTVRLLIHLSVSALCGSQFGLTALVALYFPWQSSGLRPNQWLNVLAILNKSQGFDSKKLWKYFIFHVFTAKSADCLLLVFEKATIVYSLYS